MTIQDCETCGSEYDNCDEFLFDELFREVCDNCFRQPIRGAFYELRRIVGDLEKIINDGLHLVDNLETIVSEVKNEVKNKINEKTNI